jgi:hypothetical protein
VAVRSQIVERLFDGASRQMQAGPHDADIHSEETVI